MHRRLFITLILSVLVLIASPLKAKPFTLVIDAGHGGHDAGAVGAISKEKNINLRVALAFGQYVERNCPDVKVIYTRKTDVFVTLNGRANIANRNKADLFISIHTNALPAGKISRGFEVWTLGMHRANDNLEVAKRENQVILQEKDYKDTYQGFDPNSAESYIIFEFMQDNNMHKSVELAKMIQNNVCTLANRPDKGIHQAGFLVLRETSMPSCLIELGFISTPDEEQALNNPTVVDNIARGIYNGFVKYKNKYDNDVKIPYKVESPVIPRAASAQDYNAPTDPQNDAKTKAVQISEAKSTAEVTYKVQVLTSDVPLNSNDARFHGHSEAVYYKEGTLYKYTIGEFTNIKEANALRRQLNDIFPGCFVIKMQDGLRLKD